MESLIIVYGLEGFIDVSISTPPRFLDLGQTLVNLCYANCNMLNNMVKNLIYALIYVVMNTHVSHKGIAYD